MIRQAARGALAVATDADQPDLAVEDGPIIAAGTTGFRADFVAAQDRCERRPEDVVEPNCQIVGLSFSGGGYSGSVSPSHHPITAFRIASKWCIR